MRGVTERKKKLKILWAGIYSLIDTSSGASVAIREMLLQLASRGHDVKILGATVLDSEAGNARVSNAWPDIRQRVGQWISISDGILTHKLLVTDQIVRDRVTAREEGVWHSGLMGVLATEKPDIVMFYGGHPLEMLTAIEARRFGARTVAYLGNSNFYGKRWCEDVDLLLTDSEATAKLYREREGYDVRPIGTFIDPAFVVSPARQPQHVLFVNPSIEKGAAVVCRVAMLMEKRRPDITFEVVESRGRWSDIVRIVAGVFGETRESLGNVIVTENTADMRPVYGRARLLLAPSLCWESAGRVIAEAMLNGVPAIVSNRGGPPEILGEGGMRIEFPSVCYEPPYKEIPNDAFLELIVDRIIAFHDDPVFYQHFAQGARHWAAVKHDILRNTDLLEGELVSLCAKKVVGRSASILSRGNRSL